MKPTPTARQIFQLRRATGLPVLQARDFLLQKPAELCDRILRAAEYQDRQLLHDPLEDDPTFGPVIAAALARARSEVGTVGRGTCHAIWTLARRILRDEHAIIWFPPRDMNPGGCFD